MPLLDFPQSEPLWQKIHKAWLKLNSGERKAIVDYHRSGNGRVIELVQIRRNLAKQYTNAAADLKQKHLINAREHHMLVMECLLELTKPEYKHGISQITYGSEGGKSLVFRFVPRKQRSQHGTNSPASRRKKKKV